MGRLLGRIGVGFVCALIAFIAYSVQIFVIWPWYGRVLSVELILLLAPFKCVPAGTRVCLHWGLTGLVCLLGSCGQTTGAVFSSILGRCLRAGYVAFREMRALADRPRVSAEAGRGRSEWCVDILCHIKQNTECIQATRSRS
jgi:hypothetical protein